MKFIRIALNGRPEWAVIEEKYARLIDRAPWEEGWNYLGTEIRLARAKKIALRQKGEALPEGLVMEDETIEL